MDFWDAVKELAERYHIDMDKYSIDTKKMASESDEKAKLKRLHMLTHQFFVHALSEDEHAKSYLRE